MQESELTTDVELGEAHRRPLGKVEGERRWENKLCALHGWKPHTHCMCHRLIYLYQLSSLKRTIENLFTCRVYIIYAKELFKEAQSSVFNRTFCVVNLVMGQCSNRFMEN